MRQGNLAAWVLIMLASTALLAACGGGEEKSPEQAALAQARTDYLRTCSMCHGPQGQGVGSLGNSLVDTEFMRTHSDEELTEFLKVGRLPNDPDSTTGMLMPPRGANPSLTDEDLKNIVLYMRTFSSE